MSTTKADLIKTNNTILPLPDFGDILFCWLLYLMLYLKPGLLFADGSTGWHLVCGNYILEHHCVPHFDLISYTFPHKAWIAYEWLSDLIMAIIVKAGGLNLLGIVASTAIAGLMLLLYGRSRKLGGPFLIVAIAIALGTLASSIHWLARPHLWTFFGVYVFSTTLEDFYNGRLTNKHLLISLPLFMLVWVNCHPGFLLGIAILAVYLGSALIRLSCFYSSEFSKQYFNQLKILALCTLLTLIATLVNPYLADLYIYILQYLKQTIILAATNEFSSPVFHGGIQTLSLEILYGLWIIGLAISAKKISLPSLIIALGFAHLSLSACRNMPLFVIVILPIISQLFSLTIFSPSDSASNVFKTLAKPIQTFMLILTKVNASYTETELRCRMHLVPIACLLFFCVASACHGRFSALPQINAGFDQQDKPTKTLDCIKQLKLNARTGFNLDNWGGYIRYKLDMPVFIDDRADFYGESFYLDYATLAQTLPGWQAVLKKYGITWILFPNNSRLVQILKEKPEWKLVCEDTASCLFVLQQQ